MAATFDSSLAHTRDYMRMILSDTDGLGIVTVAPYNGATAYTPGMTVQLASLYFQNIVGCTGVIPPSIVNWIQVEGPLLADETYDGLLLKLPYAEALAQATQAIISIYTKDPTKYNAGQPKAEYDYTDRLKGLSQILKDARRGNVQAPGGPARVGASVAASTAVKPLCRPCAPSPCLRGFRP